MVNVSKKIRNTTEYIVKFSIYLRKNVKPIQSIPSIRQNYKTVKPLKRYSKQAMNI